MNHLTDRFFSALNVFMAYFSDSSSLFVAGVGVVIGLLALSIMFLISTATSASRRRVRAAVAGDGLVVNGSRGARKLDSALNPYRSLVLPTSVKERAAVSQRLLSAGYRHESAISVYYFWKLVLALIFGLVSLYATTFFPTLTTLNIVLITGGMVFFGSILPSHLLDKRVSKRKRRIINAFPDMLDMLVACSEAGLGLNAALQRVSREIQPSFPDLGEELELVNAEMVAGVDRIRALRGLGERTGIEEIQGFVSMLSQSVRFGTGIAETLRIYADDFRDKRMQKAEEQAAKVGTKLLFPLVFCFFPSFFLIAVGPAVISIMKAFAVS